MASPGQSNTAAHSSPSYSPAGGPISQWFAAAEQKIERGQPLDAQEIAGLLHLLNSGFFKAATRTRYYCSYGRKGALEDTEEGPFETFYEARARAHVLVQQGYEGRIEKRYEWKNMVYSKNWHVDSDDPNAIEPIEPFPAAS
jgi:hypothetical protein